MTPLTKGILIAVVSTLLAATIAWGARSLIDHGERLASVETSQSGTAAVVGKVDGNRDRITAAEAALDTVGDALGDIRDELRSLRRDIWRLHGRRWKGEDNDDE